MGLLTDKEKGLLNQDSIEEARKGKIVYLDLEDIRLNPENIWTANDEEIRIKRQSIEEVGLLQPLLVKKTQNGYLLNTGHKRYLAIEQITREGGDYMYLGRRLKGLVPCQYLDESLAEDEFGLIAICSNAHHPDTKEERREKVWQLHQYYQKLIQEGKKPAGREREWITEMTGISDGTVKGILAYFNSDEKILNGEDKRFLWKSEKEKDVNEVVTKKLKNVNKYLSNVDLTMLTDYERQNLNELLREVQDTLETLIYAHH